jgi:O-succinylbenzoic acid--CoA ligase
MSLDVFEVSARHPDALALVTADTRLTFAQLASEVRLRGASLAARGLLSPANAPIALIARPGLSGLLALYPLWSYGITVFPLPPRLPMAEQEAWAARAKARALLDPRELSSESSLAPAPAPTVAPASSAPFAIVSTSGSSGTPKLIELSRAAFLAAAGASAKNLPLTAQDRWLLCLPLSHIGGLSILTRCLLSASAVVAFDPGASGLLAQVPALAACLSRERISVVSLVPTLLDALLSLVPRWEPSPALRAVLLGGAATNPQLLVRAKERGVPLLTTYGLTEACSQVTTTPFPHSPVVHAGLVGSGRALHGIELKIDVDQRICVRGPSLCSRLLDGELPIDEQGWLRTEDRGYLNADGELFVLGRASDLIVTGGENVDPLRVEAALLSAPGVSAAAVFGIPDTRFGERVACALVMNPGCDLVAVRAALQRTLAPSELPRLYARLEGLPLLENGKLDRKQVPAAAEGALEPWPDASR